MVVMFAERPRNGFTLVELLLAASITAILVLGVVSVLRTSIWLTDAVDADRDLQETARLLTTRLGADLRATTIVASTSRALTLVESASGDTIRWQWSGTAGDPITRRVGTGALVALADAADGVVFTSTSLQRTVDSEIVQEAVSDTLAASFTSADWSALVDSTACAYDTPRTYRIDGQSWAAEEFLTPRSMTAITEAKLRMASIGSLRPAVDLLVEIRRSSASIDQPGALYAEGTLSRMTVGGTWADVPVTFTPVDDAPLGFQEPLWLVCRGKGTALDYAGSVQVTQLTGCGHGEHPSDSNWFRETSDSGASWSARNRDVEMTFSVRGQYTTPSVVDTTETLTHTTGVGYDIQLSEGEHAVRRAGYIAQ